ncbi:MAG: ATP-binding cassette domain-containing protein [Candidatus Sumerlaeaceae bacterium]|nr:ATP-binding cassette domain-containing protein [Candidatus Sumerlaeaceae bacterium]
MKTILALEGIFVERSGTNILQDVSWKVARGENWAVFGPNGAGKSTLLSIITGYLWPTLGTVRVLGETLGQVDLRKLRRHIALVGDRLKEMMNPDLSGLHVIVSGGRAHLNIFEPPSKSEIRRAREIAEQTHLQDLANRQFAVMSTGERQRFLIARALMAEPEIVILDEPCAGLDLAGREFVLRTIDAVAAQPKAPALIFTTHHAEEISPAFSHALLLSRGEVLEQGPMSHVFTSANLSRQFGIEVSVRRTHGRWSAIAHAPNNEIARKD